MGKKSFAQRVQLRKIGMVILFFGIVVGLTACVAFWQQEPVAVLRITSPSPMDMFEVPLTVRFDISKSHGIGQDLTRFELDFGDGTPVRKGTDFKALITHTYRVAGVFYAVLTVTDAAGATGRAQIRIDTLPVHVYFSRGGIIRRIPAGGGPEATIGGRAGVYELFPSLVLNTRDRIAFTGGGWDIWTMRTDGNLPLRLTVHTDQEMQPTWSHDGGRIAYARRRAALWEIWTMTAAGANQTVLITQTPSHVWAPAFSPTNDDLVFVRQMGVAPSELWIRRGGADPVVLHRVPDERVGDPSPVVTLAGPAGAGISQPRWSPDGTKIVFARTGGVGGSIDIHVLDVPAVGPAITVRTLEAYVRWRVHPIIVPEGTITTTAHEFSPHWLEDGNIVFIRETALGVFHLYHVDLRTGALRRLTEVPGAQMPARR
ncbi:hypothetical protein LM599_04810 [Candidatus Acetothermia bacterium]|nr:hypothetical protein [Candidatus Acetothermia bacterium]